jgi:hypothetical protein
MTVVRDKECGIVRKAAPNFGAFLFEGLTLKRR